MDACIAGLTAAGILVHLSLRIFLPQSAQLAAVPLYLALALGGGPLLWNLGRRLVRLEFGSDLLAGLSIVASIGTGQYLVGALVVLMLAGGSALESYAT